MKKTTEEFEKAIESFSDNIKDIARQTRQLIFDILPNAVEVVWVQQKNIGFGTGLKKKYNCKNTLRFTILLTFRRR